MCYILKQTKKIEGIIIQGGARLQLILRWGLISSDGDAMDVALGVDGPEELNSV